MKHPLKEGLEKVNDRIKDPKNKISDTTALSRLLSMPSEETLEAIREVYGEDAGFCRDWETENEKLAAELGRVRRGGWWWPDFKVSVVTAISIFILSVTTLIIALPFYADDLEGVLDKHYAYRARKEKILYEHEVKSNAREMGLMREMITGAKEQSEDDKETIRKFIFGTKEDRSAYKEFLEKGGMDD